MRISDWSSDVCSSDLAAGGLRGGVQLTAAGVRPRCGRDGRVGRDVGGLSPDRSAVRIPVTSGVGGCAMFEAIGLFVLGLVLLALGGDSIVKGTSGLAQRMGVSPFVAGLLLVAFGTSLPELAVNARAVFTGNPAARQPLGADTD